MSSPTYASSSAKGASVYRNTALQATPAAAKTSRGRVYGWFINNTNGADTFVHFYNATTGNVTVGATTPVFTVVVKASSINQSFTGIPVEFQTATTVAATTTLGGSTDPASGLLVQVFYC